MDYSKINEKLKDFRKIRYNSKPVYKEVVKQCNGDYNDQGEEGLTIEVYDIGLENGLFIKFSITTDSYGDNEALTGIEFVQATEKKITVYEYNG